MCFETFDYVINAQDMLPILAKQGLDLRDMRRKFRRGIFLNHGFIPEPHTGKKGISEYAAIPEHKLYVWASLDPFGSLLED